MNLERRAFCAVLVSMILTVLSLVAPGLSAAVEMGAPAPDFKLPSTSGTDIALGEFKGKKWVFLEFYSSDFVPT